MTEHRLLITFGSISVCVRTRNLFIWSYRLARLATDYPHAPASPRCSLLLVKFGVLGLVSLVKVATAPLISTFEILGTIGSDELHHRVEQPRPLLVDGLHFLQIVFSDECRELSEITFRGHIDRILKSGAGLWLGI